MGQYRTTDGRTVCLGANARPAKRQFKAIKPHHATDKGTPKAANRAFVTTRGQVIGLGERPIVGEHAGCGRLRRTAQARGLEVPQARVAAMCEVEKRAVAAQRKGGREQPRFKAIKPPDHEQPGTGDERP